VPAGSAGIASNHPAAPEFIALDATARWPLAEVISTRSASVVAGIGALFGDLPTGAWRRRPAQAVVLPLAGSGQAGKTGILVIGLNPYRLFDDAYRGFLGLVAGQSTASITNALAYEAEKQRAEALAELDRAKTTFFSNISHEFRTPLALILGPLEELLREPLPGQIHQQLEFTHRNSLRLLKLVNTLLDFSRIEAGRIEAVYEATDLAAYTADLASVFRSAIETAGLKLVVSCPPLAEPVYVDREMWEKILLNLLSNAFKFTFEGEIVVTLAARDGRVELTVADSGVGIAEAELPRIFERFHRARNTRARTYESAGIGLALVQELVNLPGGNITVQSTAGRGTTFTVALPAGAGHFADEVLAKAAPTEPAQA
jgi:signal transduction histidine kinase